VPAELGPPKGQRGPRRSATFSVGLLAGWLSKHWKLTLGGVLLIVYASVHVYYYNMLVDLEFDVQETWAQVEVHLERRHNIQENLTRIAKDYSVHEREVLVALTEMRAAKEIDNVPGATDAGAGGTAGGEAAAAAALPDLGGMESWQPGVTGSPLDGIPAAFQLTAEEYPTLYMGQIFMQFSDAVIENENRIVERTVEFNSSANIYSTAIKQRPTNIFAGMMGFEMEPYYIPEEDTMLFETVEY